MKKFTLEIKRTIQDDNKKEKVVITKYQVRGESLESVTGWESGVPKLWKENTDKIKVEDITKDIEEIKKKEDQIKLFSSMLFDLDNKMSIQEIKEKVLSPELPADTSPKEIEPDKIKVKTRNKKEKKDV